MLGQLLKAYPDTLRIVYRHFPLNSIHDKAALAAQASEAAGNQGKFWELHDHLFQTQNDWASITLEEFQDWLEKQAKDLGLNVDQFMADLNDPTIIAYVEQEFQKSRDVGLPGTPFLVINSMPYQVPATFGTLSGIIDSILLESRQYTTCPPMIIDPAKTYIATLTTEKGDVVIELFADQAPLAVNSFVFLARQGWFDNVTFHRVLPNFVAQSGDPSGSGMGGPGYEFDNETSPELKYDKAGVVGMANAGPNTNGSQFFITFQPTPNLDGGYTIFGQVISGMDVAENLTARDPSSNPNQAPGDKILSVTIQEK